MITRRELLQRGALLAGALAVSAPAARADAPLMRVHRGRKRVLVWSEGTAPKNVYPHDINTAIADGLREMNSGDIRTASLDDPDQGISDETLDGIDVLIWWGHLRHAEVHDDRVAAIIQRVRAGKIGFIGTHSAHWSKPFTRMMGTSCSWEGGYHEDGSRVLVSVLAPQHPVAHGLQDFIIPHTERYTEPFIVPLPDVMIFGGMYTLPGGTQEKSHQGMAWSLDQGRIFYFQPGHESYPIYYQKEVRQVFHNAVAWI